MAWTNAARSGSCPLSEALLELGKTIYAMANAGELKALKIGGQWRMRKIGMMGFAWLGACGAPVDGLEPLLDLECSPMQIELYAEVGGADSTVVHCPSARVAATDVSVTGSSSIQVRDVEPAGADVTRIVVQFTPADLQPPVHAAILEVAPRVGRVATVSVMGTVRSAGAPEIWVPETVDVIPPCGTCDRQNRVLPIINTGDADLVVRGVAFERDAFRLESSLPLIVPPDEAGTLELSYAPWGDGRGSIASMSISTNDPVRPETNVRLRLR